MMTICKDCKAQMRPLFTGWYCPNDCDRKYDLTPNTSPVYMGTTGSQTVKKLTGADKTHWWAIRNVQSIPANLPKDCFLTIAANGETSKIGKSSFAKEYVFNGRHRNLKSLELVKDNWNKVMSVAANKIDIWILHTSRSFLP